MQASEFLHSRMVGAYQDDTQEELFISLALDQSEWALWSREEEWKYTSGDAGLWKAVWHALTWAGSGGQGAAAMLHTWGRSGPWDF